MFESEIPKMILRQCITHKQMHTHLHTYTYTCMNAHMHTHTYVHTHTHTYIHTHTCMQTTTCSQDILQVYQVSNPHLTFIRHTIQTPQTVGMVCNHT